MLNQWLPVIIISLPRAFCVHGSLLRSLPTKSDLTPFLWPCSQQAVWPGTRALLPLSSCSSAYSSFIQRLMCPESLPWMLSPAEMTGRGGGQRSLTLPPKLHGWCRGRWGGQVSGGPSGPRAGRFAGQGSPSRTPLVGRVQARRSMAGRERAPCLPGVLRNWGGSSHSLAPQKRDTCQGEVARDYV